VSVALQKIDGIDTVKVTLNDGKATLTLKPLNKVTLAQVRSVIEKNGFTPKAAAVVAETEVIAGPGGEPQLRVSGTNETFPVASGTAEAVRAILRNQVGNRVLVQGIVPPFKENPAGPMDVKDVKPATR
jgi:copper chaperone CopZ